MNVNECILGPIFIEIGQLPDFTLLDLRGSKPFAWDVHYRSFFQERWRTKSLWLPSSALAVRHQLQGRPLVLLQGSQDYPDHKSVYQALDNLPHTIVTDLGDGQLQGERGLLPEPAVVGQMMVDYCGTTTITLKGSRPERFSNEDLPLRVRVELHAGRQLLGIEATAHTTPPPPQWYYLQGFSDTRLVVDVVPGFPQLNQVDRWSLRLEPTGTIHLAPDPGKEQPVTSRRLEQLAFVFDRTCPDRNRWSTARSLLLRREAPANMPPPATLNQEIREGVAAGLEQAGRQLSEVVGWGVADTAGDGLSPPDSVALASPLVPLGSERPAGISRLLAQAGWAPGLDLWDPMEEGLASALDRLECSSQPGAVLLIGNSPPTPDKRWDSVVARTSVRSRPIGGPPTPARWAEQLARAKGHAIPVAWLFLIHDQCELGDERNMEQDRHIQERIVELLKLDLPVVCCLADRSSVMIGIQQIYDILISDQQSSPRARILRDRLG